jgi:hypothetical protein
MRATQLALDSTGRPIGRILDMRSRRQVRPPPGLVFEWDTRINGSTVTALTGQIKYSGALIPDVAPADDLTCDMTDITDGQTWYLFVEASLGAGTIELKVQAARPVDDPANKILRVSLSKWTRTGDFYTRDRILHRGAIQISGVWNQ